ncbi:serine hydrolase [Antrihabitans sp. YC2-6]|uniref:serine hydrolase n=1 Tax=Antrihabitans sp. YC2-6 TaxID=2799498 RepID=UPI002277818E|nr:serine hydrolase [Antrihabitans sp. YC2-6]
MSWRLGYHSFPSANAPRAFGHIGLAGSGGIADPATGLAMAFVHNRVPNPRFLPLDQTILAWLAPLVFRGLRPVADDRVTPIRRARTAS